VDGSGPKGLVERRDQDARLRSSLIFSPGPVHACIGVILCLAGYGVAVAEQKLLAGVMLEVVVASHVDHRRAPSLRRRKAFAPMREDFGAHSFDKAAMKNRSSASLELPPATFIGPPVLSRRS